MRAAGVLAVIVLAVVAFPTAASAAKKQSVGGGWIGAIPCAFTSYTPSPGAPTTGDATCSSGSFWDGSWTGQTTYTAKGKINFLTGDSTGTVDETFNGISTSDDSTGTLHFLERYHLDGATNVLHIDCRIVGGTGDWVGSRGHAVFDAFQLLGLVGHGGYSGTWIRR